MMIWPVTLSNNLGTRSKSREPWRGSAGQCARVEVLRCDAAVDIVSAVAGLGSPAGISLLTVVVFLE